MLFSITVYITLSLISSAFLVVILHPLPIKKSCAPAPAVHQSHVPRYRAGHLGLNGRMGDDCYLVIMATISTIYESWMFNEKKMVEICGLRRVSKNIWGCSSMNRYFGVSINGGTRKWIVSVRDTPISGNHHI